MCENKLLEVVNNIIANWKAQKDNAAAADQKLAIALEAADVILAEMQKVCDCKEEVVDSKEGVPV
jgi:hypothetical protein